LLLHFDDVVIQSCPWVGLTHGLGWVGPGWVEIFQFLVGWVGSTTAKVLKNLNRLFNVFKARLDKIWLHKAVKFDFMADLTGTGIKPIRRSNKVIMLANDS